MTSSFKQLSVGASFSAGSGGGDDHQSGVDDTVSSLRSKGNSISFEARARALRRARPPTGRKVSLRTRG